jgi:hypothetical protein
MQIHCKTCTLPKNIGCEDKNGACPYISARNRCAKSNMQFTNFAHLCRLQRCTRCFNHLQKIQQVLHPLMMQGGESAQLAQELSLSLQDLVVI